MTAWLGETATEKARAPALHAAGRAAARELVAEYEDEARQPATVGIPTAQIDSVRDGGSDRP
jgi:hypothetical protein